MSETLSTALHALLEEERTALKHGQLESLRALTERKTALLNDLGAAELPRKDVDILQAHLTRNQALLESALEGIRGVANRLVELRNAKTGLETYDQSGTRARFATHQPQALEKRA